MCDVYTSRIDADFNKLVSQLNIKKLPNGRRVFSLPKQYDLVILLDKRSPGTNHCKIQNRWKSSLIPTPGTRILLCMDNSHFQAWGIDVPFLEVGRDAECHYLQSVDQSPREFHGDEEDHDNNPDLLFSHNIPLCSCGKHIQILVELNTKYPFDSPVISCVSFPIDELAEQFKNLRFEDYCGEGWVPGITLESLLIRISAFLRQQLVNHLVAAHGNQLRRRQIVGAKRSGRVIESSGGVSHVTSYLFYFVLTVVIVHGLFGFLPHSGQFNAPRYGDYEAQRHWMELTNTLDWKGWYVPSDRNDMTYWGIDYPPLSAYHAMICGAISKIISPSSMLNSLASRGYLTSSHKIFMRLTVLMSELLVFIPALITWTWSVAIPRFAMGSSPTKTHQITAIVVMAAVVLSPPFILIDFVHFQYNCVALGLIIWSLWAMEAGRLLVGSLLVCAAVLFKQTMLYFVPPMVCFVLSRLLLEAKQRHAFILLRSSHNTIVPYKCNKTEKAKVLTLWIKSLLVFSVSVMALFGVVLLPFFIDNSEDTSFLLGGPLTYLHWKNVLPIVQRVFPFHRGLIEDYVSNIWIAFNPIFHFRSVSPFNVRFYVLMSAVLTFLAFIVPLVDLWNHPTHRKLELSLVITSLAFYLFSFHVHEKSILLPLTIATMTLPSHRDKLTSMLVCFLLMLATISLAELAHKDFVLSEMFVYSIVFMFTMLKTSVGQQSLMCPKIHLVHLTKWKIFILRWVRSPVEKVSDDEGDAGLSLSELLFSMSMILLWVLGTLSAVLVSVHWTPLMSKPYFAAYIQSLVCAIGFLACWMGFSLAQLSCPPLKLSLGDLPSGSTAPRIQQHLFCGTDYIRQLVAGLLEAEG